MDDAVGVAAIFCLTALRLLFLAVAYDVHVRGDHRTRATVAETEVIREANKIRRGELEFAKRVRTEDREKWVVDDEDE